MCPSFIIHTYIALFLRIYLLIFFRRQQQRKRNTAGSNTLSSYLNIIMFDLRFCGPKLSFFGILLSIWGIVQLSLMALSFYSRSIALVEDLNFNETDTENYKVNMDTAYDTQAFNCAIAAAIYVLTLVVSWHQYWLNNRATPNRYQRHY